MALTPRLLVSLRMSFLWTPLLGLCSLQAQGSGLSVDDFEFDVTTINGERISQDDFKDKVLLVDFWGTWCPPCRKAVPHLQALYKKYKDKGLEIVGLNYREGEGDKAVAKVRRFAEKNGLTYQLALGTAEIRDQVKKFRGYPTLLFFDRGLQFSHLDVGFREGDEKGIEEWIQDALAKEAPEDKEPEFKRLFLETEGGPKIEIGNPDHYELLILVHPKAQLGKADMKVVRALEDKYPKLLSVHLLSRADLPAVPGSLRVKKENLSKIRLGKAFPAALLYNRAGAGNSRATGLGGERFGKLLTELAKKLETDAAAKKAAAKTSAAKKPATRKADAKVVQPKKKRRRARL
jgi:thiol-disulfide isomerase/thioredoxin